MYTKQNFELHLITRIIHTLCIHSSIITRFPIFYKSILLRQLYPVYLLLVSWPHFLVVLLLLMLPPLISLPAFEKENVMLNLKWWSIIKFFLSHWFFYFWDDTKFGFLYLLAYTFAPTPFQDGWTKWKNHQQPQNRWTFNKDISFQKWRMLSSPNILWEGSGSNERQDGHWWYPQSRHLMTFVVVSAASAVALQQMRLSLSVCW